MSRYSPGKILPDEQLARFAFHPIFYDKKGNLKPNIFSHVHSAGCSVQRDTVATDSEITDFVFKVLREKPEWSWKGVLLANCSALRSILAKDNKKRAACVYDTADKGNPAHAEICQTRHIGKDNGDENELRGQLFKAFGDGIPITPPQYRDGNVFLRVTAPPGDQKVSGRI